MNTLLLDRSTWDLLLDASGNIAVASDVYAIAQDISSAVRVFLGECWYDTTQGMPYRQNILGRSQSVAAFEKQVEQVALTVTGVADAQCLVSGLTTSRQMTGTILFTTTSGSTGNVNL
ncbi:hypothetical protein [Komagataeibacter xylinus]|uniref:DUF2634 domain-containing protein n=1 Tax=Komagataeibacter xylinus TaxID=28448 RepID=A0A857FJ27_KOMXY|nr:hypothetical protein [Komagataeibacter xylinus]QHC34168.1 hypothetical protein FMA36_00340 [Komagataeibacter xylinus]